MLMKLRRTTSHGKRWTHLSLATVALGATGAAAQEQPEIDFSQFEGINEKGWFVRLGGRALFNANASVNRTPSQPTTQGYYDNGFVLPDAGGTASGLTWNWGYEDAAQASGSSLNYERYIGLPDAGSFDDQSEIAPGAEMMIGIRFGEFQVGERTWEWGAEFGGGYNFFEIAKTETATATSTYRTASHDTNGILLPVAPYQGTFNGPGPVIDLNPSSTTDTSTAATSTVDGTLDTQLYNLKIGIWFDMPLTQKLHFGWSAGFSSLYAESSYQFTESVALANPGVPTLTDVDTTVSGRNWLQGGYIQLRLQYEFNDKWSAYVGADYQYNAKFNFSGAGRDVNLDFTKLLGASVGVQFNW